MNPKGFVAAARITSKGSTPSVRAIMATSFKRKLWGGIALGALGAAAGTYGGFYLRKGLTKGAGLADLPVAISGDAASIALAIRSLRRLTA